MGGAATELSRTSVMLVEDHEMARRSIRMLLASDSSLSLIREITDGEEAVKAAAEMRPAVVLMDISLPGISGIEAARQIRRSSPEARIIFVSQHDAPAIVREALGIGAQGYVVKSDAGQDLLAAIRTTGAGKTFMSRSLRREKPSSVPEA
jgi:DNA-binding NarL/FixJ family response regulator